METVKQLIDKANMLPFNLQEQLVDFADFLLEKHQSNQQQDDLDEATLELLDDRIRDFEANLDKAIPVKEYIESIKQRYQK